MSRIVFIDTEVDSKTNQVLDYGAINASQNKLHTKSKNEFAAFVRDNRFICGHNIIAHDLKYISDIVDRSNIKFAIDTLYISPLLFANKPYHALVKDDKLQSDEWNNPLNDSIKAMNLFYDEVNAFEELESNVKKIFCNLLYEHKEFYGFFEYMQIHPDGNTEQLIRSVLSGKICFSSNIISIINSDSIALAYCIALILSEDKYSIIPHWVHIKFPTVEKIMRQLRSTPCADGCDYCNKELNVYAKLKSIFGYDDFRTYDGEPLQEQAIKAAVNNDSLIAIFPTGGGKSITFQLPALISGEATRGLTVVISPLQSLMKDQVDNLEKKGIADAVAINGLLSPVERAEAYERVENGLASLLYISPESLRSRALERLLMSRNVTRFVIDEAHCFSAWGQDFRVDYLYIGDFIRELQEKKKLDYKIPVSCFTATAKQKVISDIKLYFKDKLDLDLDIYATNAVRSNLRYEVLHKENDDEKYTSLRELIEQRNCPTIVYVSRTKRTFEIAGKLCRDGFKALPFNGKMESSQKQENQDAFINDKVQIIVATSAFGMGVDKPNVKLVVHYDISESLENYVQEAGRAGRDQSLNAECYVLYNDGDLDKHFALLNQTKLNISEIQQVWKAIKDFTKIRSTFCRSPLEIARQAGWDDTVPDIETRVKNAVQALENSGYVKRGKNVPHCYANSILVPDMMTAAAIIERSSMLDDNQKINARRIISALISSKSIAKAGNDDAESRVDYISDRLGINKADVIHIINILREEGILADNKDLNAYIRRSDSKNKSLAIFNRFISLEEFILSQLDDDGGIFCMKELNEKAIDSGVKNSTVNNIKTILYYWTIRSYIEKNVDNASNNIDIKLKLNLEKMVEQRRKSIDIAKFIVNYLYDVSSSQKSEKEEMLVQFSIVELKNSYEQSRLFKVSQYDIEDALLYLSKIEAMKLEGGFLVIYNSMEITRLELDNKIKYKKEDYKQLNEFYKQKIQQIHIVGEYANMMVRDYGAALQFINDYFHMDYKKFINKYFEGKRSYEIEQNITPQKYNKIFGTLSERQLEIINDKSSQYIVVAAGPGSGKTRLLVHKLASIYMLEDVKHEQMLMVTFSRAAVTEFKIRLHALIGNAANFIEIKTFHSYCFDLLGKIGSLENSENIVRDATQKIIDGEVELGKITKTVIVIDEAQDMDCNEFALIEALMERNEEMRVIAVGDDDQNIYEFRGSSSKYMRSFINDKNATCYELLENYRSCKAVVELANKFAETITDRMKSERIISKSNKIGDVKLIRHYSRNLEEAIAEDIIHSFNGINTACVLTSTNDEALNMVCLLNSINIKAKLIQSNDGFRLYDLVEIRYFIKKINEELVSPIISDSSWNKATEELKIAYSTSDCLGLCLTILDDYVKTTSKKYITDFMAFLKESNIEDFCHVESGTVFVSTIHKSKGREFDNVYMLLDNINVKTDEERRKIYVGMTRAKTLLHIHYNNDIFDAIEAEYCQKSIDKRSFKAPDQIVMQLTHRDVFLDYFKDKKNFIFRLRSGMKLRYVSNGLQFVNSSICYDIIKFSGKFNEKLKNLIRKGYVPTKARIRYIVAWKGKEDLSECAVVLAEITLKKNGTKQ